VNERIFRLVDCIEVGIKERKYGWGGVRTHDEPMNQLLLQCGMGPAFQNVGHPPFPTPILNVLNTCLRVKCEDARLLLQQVILYKVNFQAEPISTVSHSHSLSVFSRKFPDQGPERSARDQRKQKRNTSCPSRAAAPIPPKTPPVTSMMCFVPMSENYARTPPCRRGTHGSSFVRLMTRHTEDDGMRTLRSNGRQPPVTKDACNSM
jgi:hypothetical protein